MIVSEFSSRCIFDLYRQCCRARYQSPSNLGWLELEPKTFRWWSRSLKFGFWFHSPSSWVKWVVQTCNGFQFL